MTTLSLYPPSAFDVYNKIKINYSSSIDAACDEIRKACKGLGTDEKALIKVLGTKSPNDRALIAYRYKELYNEELKALLQSEAGGDFGFLLQLLAVPLPEAEAYIIKYATAGAGTDEKLIYPIIMGRTNEEMQILRKTYYDTQGKDLAVVLDNELGGDFKKVIMTALQAQIIEYKSSFHTDAKAEEDADKLYKAGEGKWGTDEEGFLKVLFSSPPKHVQNINAVYQRKYNSSLKNAAEGEFTGDAERALVFHIRSILEPRELLADYFESTMKGLGTDEKSLSSALVRYHPYLNAFASNYEQAYKMSLKDRIKGETSGDYGELLLKVYDAPATNPGN
jgi:hypothetical protein